MQGLGCRGCATLSLNVTCPIMLYKIRTHSNLDKAGKL